MSCSVEKSLTAADRTAIFHSRHHAYSSVAYTTAINREHQASKTYISRSCPSRLALRLIGLTIAIALSVFLPANALGDAAAGNVKITGIVKKVSIFPNPAQSSYPDCFYSALLEDRDADGNNIEYLVLFKCFENYCLISDNIVKPGDALFVEAVPFENLSKAEQSIQQADQIERFDLECYVARKVSQNAAPEKSPLPKDKISGRKKREIFIPPPPVPEQIKRSIKVFIENDRTLIARKLAARERRGKIHLEYLPDVLERRNALQKEPGTNGFVFWEGDALVYVPVKKEITLLPPSAINISNRNAKDVLVAFDRELKKRNIRFIFVSFPLIEEIYYAHFSQNVSMDESFDAERLKTLKYLLDHDVEVIDMGELFSRHFSEYPFFQDIIRNDSHPLSPALTLLADELEKRLSMYDWNSYRFSPEAFKKDSIDNTFKKSYPDGNEKFKGIYRIERYIDRLPRGMKSPIFVLGDSFSLTPWGSGGIIGCLGNRLRLPVDNYSNQSGKCQLARTISARSYLPLSQKQIVIMVVEPGFGERWAPLVSEKRRIVFALSKSEHLLEKWQGAVKDEDGFRINMTGGKNNQSFSNTYEIPLDIKSYRGKKLSIEVTTYTCRSSFQLRNCNDEYVAASPPTGPEDSEDSLIIDMPDSYFSGNRFIKIRFVNRKSAPEIKIKDIIISVDAT